MSLRWLGKRHPDQQWDGHLEYTYDELDRLMEAEEPWGTLTYSYDEVGNRVEMQVGQTTTSYTYNEMNELTKKGGDDDYTYDANGNLIRREDGADHWDYTYDYEDRLVKVEKNDVTQEQYWYDADGRRVKITAESSLTVHVYSGLDIIDEISGGSHTKHYYMAGMHIAENRSGTVEYYHQDHLGSTRLKASRWPPGKPYKRKHFRLHWRLGRDPGPGEDAG